MKIPSKLLRAAQFCQANGDCRSFINGVHIFGNTIEATNGHVAVRMTMIKKASKSIIVNIKGKVPKSAYESKLVISNNETIVKHYDKSGALTSVQVVNLIDGDYPDLDRVIPNSKDSEPVSKIGLNVDYLSLFSKMFSATKPNAKIEFFGENNAIKLTSENAITNLEFGNPELVVMPCRMD